MLDISLSRNENIRNRTWVLTALAFFTLTILLGYKPSYASDEVVNQNIKSVLEPKPQKSWDERIAPQLHKAEIQRQEAIEAERVAEEAKQQSEANAKVAVQAIVAQPSQPVPVTGSCADWMSAAGITDKASAHILIMRESGCNPGAVNPSSGACGIPQALPCSKLGTTDPVGQMRWMQNYVMSRYGSWANALAHSNAKNWY